MREGFRTDGRGLRILAAMCVCVPAAMASAEVSLPSLWADHAVIQRELPVRVWGRAAAGEHVRIRFRGAEAEAVADGLGQWKASLPPGHAGGPFPMEIAGTNEIVLKDLMVGDVWVASGQSNMEFSTSGVNHAEEALKQANDPKIRLFHVEKVSSDFKQYDVKTKGWTAATSATVAEFSAVAYFFAKQITADQGVTVGLIEADWGGTPGETWTSAAALSADGSLMPAWSTWAQMTESEETTELQERREAREKAEALGAGKPAPEQPGTPSCDRFCREAPSTA